MFGRNLALALEENGGMVYGVNWRSCGGRDAPAKLVLNWTLGGRRKLTNLIIL